MVSAVLKNTSLVPSRMQLYLIYRRNDICRLQQRLQMVGKEVRDADGFDAACPVQLFQGLPCVAVDLLPVIPVNQIIGRPVNEIQVQIFQSQVLQGLFKGCHGPVISPVRLPDLSGDKDFFPGDPAVADAGAYAGFIPVKGRSVDMAVARPDRRRHGSLCLLRGCIICAESHTGNLISVVKLNSVLNRLHNSLLFKVY